MFILINHYKNIISIKIEMRIVWRKFLISVLILFCVSIKFFSSAINVPASHETDVLYNYLDAPTFHSLSKFYCEKTFVQVARESDWS